MNDALINQLVIGIGATVFGGLILYYIFGIGKNKNKAGSKTVGILNKGKHNKFVNNSFSGLDVGIQDEGENTTAEGNDFK